MVANVRLCAVADCEALHLQNTITMIRDTDLQTTTEPDMNYTTC